MKKRLLPLLISLMLTVSLLFGCSSGKKSDSAKSVAPSEGAGIQATATSKGPVVNTEFDGVSEKPSETKEVSGSANSGEKTVADDATAITGGGSDVRQLVSNAILAERKIIRKANITVEVENFDRAQSQINTFILGIGYVQESNINTEKFYVNSEVKLIKSGTIIIRVDKDKFDKVINDIKGIGLVIGENIGTEDVTERYFDIESRLRLLRFEEQRLEEYLKKLEDPDTIFKTESRLTDIRHEIEGLTGNLRKLSELTELSTITINMYEKNPYAGNVNKQPRTYGQRLRDSFLDSVRGVVSFCGDLLILLVQILPVLILLGIFLLIAFTIFKKINKNRFNNKSKNEKINSEE
ncbi:MAG TPA: DUF4349 domain-containing protein [Clostridiaceae bacterium]|nr:DUF4349 domain-containing protein [Clostridiaceae bacterium]